MNTKTATPKKIKLVKGTKKETLPGICKPVYGG